MADEIMENIETPEDAKPEDIKTDDEILRRLEDYRREETERWTKTLEKLETMQEMMQKSPEPEPEENQEPQTEETTVITVEPPPEPQPSRRARGWW